MNSVRAGMILVLSEAAIACSDTSHPIAPESPDVVRTNVLAASQPAPTTSEARFELRFLEGMIDHP